jgi:hypothetical protein
MSRESRVRERAPSPVKWTTVPSKHGTTMVWDGGFAVAEIYRTQDVPILTAAPDLLAAAEEALRFLESAGWQSHMADAEARVTLRAAIARARGDREDANG